MTNKVALYATCGASEYPFPYRSGMAGSALHTRLMIETHTVDQYTEAFLRKVRSDLFPGDAWRRYPVDENHLGTILWT